MHIDQLLYLIEISNSPSINVASEKLNISYQALSHSVKALENELHLTLLTRTNKGSILTADGEKLVSLAKLFVKGIEQLQSSHADAVTQISGTVHFLTTDVCMEYFLFDLMDYCKTIYPDIQFETEISYDQQHFFDILQQDPKAFFLSFWGAELFLPATLPESLRKICIAQTEMRCICSPLHELASNESVSLKQLKKYDYLLRNSSAKNSFRSELFRAVYSESNPFLFEKKILSGHYITVCNKVPFSPYWIPQVNNSKKLVIQTLSDLHLAMICHNDFQMTPQAKAFLEILCHKFSVPMPTALLK